MTEVEDYFQNSQLMARQANVASLDADPEQAGEALDLSDSTGVPATAIYGDLDGFKRAHKAALGSAIIGDNEYIADYLNSHPMAPRVSHDDLGALDDVSRAVAPMGGESKLQQWLKSDSIAKSFQEGFGEQPFGQTAFQRPNDVEWALSHPLIASAVGAATMPLEALSRVTGGVLHMGYEGMSSIFGEKFAREMAGMAEYGMMRGDIGVKGFGGEVGGPLARVEANSKLLRDMRNGLDLSDLYTGIGREPPAGVHPLIDKAKELQTKEDLDVLDDALKASQKSATRERSPEFFANFLRSQLGDREIGISADAVRGLYGDKPPAVDDNILGWIPDLDQKLLAAEGVGGDIQVRLADWLAKVDPDVAKELHDDIRVRDDGITINEGKVEAEPKEVIPEPLTSVRGSAGLEPIFQVGDRKLSIEKYSRQAKEPGATDMFRLLDENGNKVGFLETRPSEDGTQVYVENIGGFEHKGFGPNSFGPALTRSLIRQMKEVYPNLKEIGGFRISGAREKAGTTGAATIKVQEGGPLSYRDHEYFKSLLTQNWEEMGQGLLGLFHEDGKGLAADSPMGQMVLAELRRLVPDAESDVAHQLKATGGHVHGVYMPNLRSIIVSLRSRDPIGTARHESIHALRRMGLLTEDEWSTLERASQSEGWMEKYDVAERWKNFKDVDLPEESIAEAFRDWHSGSSMSKEVHPIFEKIKAFFENLRQTIAKMLGHDLTWEQIFEKIDSGEIGAREAEPMEGEGELATQPADEGGEGEKPSGLYDRGKALGVTQTHLDRMEKLIAKRNEEDFKSSQRRAEVRQRRRSNKEWKERRTQLRDEVREALGSRPDLALDQLFSKQNIKIDPATLSDEQKSRLPRDYIQKKDGVNPDDLAPYFGYTSGDALVERLAMLTEDRRRSGMSARDYFNRLVDVETDRRLNREFGNREQNILDEAKDQALSETQLNLTHEETLAYALKAGQEPQFTKEQTRAMVKSVFDQTPVNQIKSDRLLQKAGMIGKKIEEAGAKGDWAEAYRLSQQRNHAVIAAKFARDYEKSRRQFDRTAKTFSKNRTFTGVEQEYVNWIQDLLLRTGHGLSRSVQDLQENIGRQPQTTLDKFIEAKEAHFMGERQLDVPDFLREPDFKKNVDDLTAYEFEGLRQGIKILEKAGRDEKSIIVGGEAQDLSRVKTGMRQLLESFGYSDAKFNLEQSKFRFLREMAYGLTNMETLLNRWDRGSPMGLFNQVVIRPLVEAANAKSAMLRSVAKELNELKRPTAKELSKLVDAPFADPKSPGGQGTWTGFNRGNVLMMLQNAGNKSNWNVLARGLGAEPEGLFRWLQKNVTREDVERAQSVGAIFKKLIAKSDDMYERVTGATVEKIPLEPIEFTFADGTKMTTDGWYHPLDRDPHRASMWKDDPETGERIRTGAQSRDSAFKDADYFHASTSNGYTKKRTGAVYPVNLDFNMVPTRMRQIIHDIHFREPLLNVEKIFADRLFREDVAKYYGTEYADGLMPYLRHLAGSEGIHSASHAWAEAFLEKARQNIISTYIGFNPFTVFKHMPTAAWFSSKEVGAKDFLKAYAEVNKPGTADLNKFIMDNSEELQRRERHWQDTMAGQGNELSGKGTIRERIIENGSKWVAKSDMISARPTWWAAYQQALAKGETHGTAAFLADRAVRRAHGSTAETNLPPVVRAGGIANRYFTSVYGFFGTAMQRRIELAHEINDTYKLGREGELKQAAKNVPSLLNNFMAYVVVPTLIEEAVTGLTTEDRRGWGMYMLAGATMGLSSSVLYLRDLMYGLTTGHDPGAGLISSAMHDVANVARDIRRGTGAIDKQHAGKTVEDTLTMFGELTGKMPKTAARAARFGIDVATGQQKPKTPVEWMRGLAHGEAVRRKR
jgi:hypothetical protein